MKRFVFEIILISFIVNCTATSLKYIDLVASWEQKMVELYKWGVYRTIYVNKPFTMRMQTDIPITGVRCSIIEPNLTSFQLHETQNFSVGVDLIQDNVYVLKKNWTITNGKMLLWKCEVLYPPDGTKTISFELKVYIEDREIKNEMFVNGQRMNTSQNYETGYHEEVNYFFREGELAEIKCMIRGHHSKDATNITTVLYENNKPALFSKHLLQHIWYIKLSEEYNGSHIDCNAQLETLPGAAWYTIRMNLIKKDNVDKLPTMYVNDLVLAPLINDSGTYKYTYLFYKGELLTITGVMTKNPDRKCYIEGHRDDVSHQLEEFGKHEIINTTLNADINVKIICDDIIFSLLDKMFINLDPYISGLSMAQTELTYHKNETTYITKYDNHGKNTLKLTCISYKTTGYCKLKYNETEVIASNVITWKFDSLLLKLKEKYSNTIITCTCIDHNGTESTAVVDVFNATLTQTVKSNTASDLWWITGAILPIIIVITLSKFIVHRNKCTVTELNCNDDPPGCADDPDYEEIIYSDSRNTTASDITQRPPLPPPNLPPAPDSAQERVPPNIAQRPPLPLPDLASDSALQGETPKYIHYDTPYEERLKHMLMMNPPIRPPCKCCPNNRH